MTQASRRVLVVDDNADMRSSLKQLLSAMGYEVDTAEDGSQALDRQRENEAGVVITDIFMVGTEGLETIAALKREWPDVRVIAMSGGGVVAKKNYLDSALYAGADATLQKPFSLESLKEALRHPA